MGCSCSANLSEKQLSNIKNEMNTRNEKLIVDWSSAKYNGGLYGNNSTEGKVCLTNIHLYFLAKSINRSDVVLLKSFK